MVYEVVKYHSEINKIALKEFTENELNLLMVIMTQMKDQGLTEITFSFDEIREISQYGHRSIDKLYSDLQTTYDKLIQCRLGWENEKEIVRFVLFTRYAINKEKQTVSVRVNEEFFWVLNELATWTTFELSEFISLQGKYTKEIYRRLKQFRMKGYWMVRIDEFKRLLDVPKSYRMKDIDKKILYPALEELAKIFPDFDIEKYYDDKKRGRPVRLLKFIFGKDKPKGILNQDGTFTRLVSTDKPNKQKRRHKDKPVHIIKYTDYNDQVEHTPPKERFISMFNMSKMFKFSKYPVNEETFEMMIQDALETVDLSREELAAEIQELK